jgi:hypothetical protein
MTAVALPQGWPDHVRSSLLHAIVLASTALAVARSRRVTHGLRTDLERATQEIALLKEKLAVRDARWSRRSPRRRPHFAPEGRMRPCAEGRAATVEGLTGASGGGSPRPQTGLS